MGRLVAALAVVIAPVLIIVPLVLSWRDRLPARLASHWGLGPEPDSFTDRDPFLDGWAVAALAAAGLCVVIALLMRRGRRIAVLVMGAVTGFLAALGLVLTLPNLDLADPREATVSWEAAVPLALMVAIAGLAWWVHGSASDPVVAAEVPPARDLPRLAPGVPARYDEVQVQWMSAAVVFALMAGLGLAISIFLTPWLGVELALIGLALVWLNRTRIRVSAGDDVALSAGFVAHRVPVAEVTGAHVREDVNPFAEFGGWGLRYRSRAVALVVKRGPGVEVGRTDDRRVVITCSKPERLAAVVNTLADERFAQADG